MKELEEMCSSSTWDSIDRLLLNGIWCQDDISQDAVVIFVLFALSRFRFLRSTQSEKVQINLENIHTVLGYSM